MKCANEFAKYFLKCANYCLKGLYFLRKASNLLNFYIFHSLSFSVNTSVEGQHVKKKVKKTLYTTQKTLMLTNNKEFFSVGIMLYFVINQFLVSKSYFISPHCGTKPSQWCMGQKWVQSALFLASKKFGLFLIQVHATVKFY